MGWTEVPTSLKIRVHRTSLFKPECTDIVVTIQLMSFLLFEGQADKGNGHGHK